MLPIKYSLKNHISNTHTHTHTHTHIYIYIYIDIDIEIETGFSIKKPTRIDIPENIPNQLNNNIYACHRMRKVNQCMAESIQICQYLFVYKIDIQTHKYSITHTHTHTHTHTYIYIYILASVTGKLTCLKVHSDISIFYIK